MSAIVIANGGFFCTGVGGGWKRIVNISAAPTSITLTIIGIKHNASVIGSVWLGISNRTVTLLNQFINYGH